MACALVLVPIVIANPATALDLETRIHRWACVVNGIRVYPRLVEASSIQAGKQLDFSGGWTSGRVPRRGWAMRVVVQGRSHGAICVSQRHHQSRPRRRLRYRSHVCVCCGGGVGGGGCVGWWFLFGVFWWLVCC